MNRNIILDTDSYKNDHGRMLRKGTEYIYSTVVPRKGNGYTSQVVVAGIQYVVEEYLSKPITLNMIKEALVVIESQGYTFDSSRWEYILEKYNGYLPLKISAIPEGTVVPVGCPLAVVENTDPKCAWLVSYIETMFLRCIWYMTTVASNALDIKQYLGKVMKQHENTSYVDFHLHNFGCRGASSYESSVMAGMAHAMLFSGSDDLMSNRSINYYYPNDRLKPPFIPYTYSVIASEHSVSCSNADSEKRNDFNIAVKMLDILEEELDKMDAGVIDHQPIVSIVIDTYDSFRFIRDYLGTKLRDRVIELGKRGGKIVARPDSGDPIEMPIRILEMLTEIFGYTVNPQGYKVLPPYLGVLQGDGINSTSIREICEKLENKKLSLANIVFGMGGKLTHPERGRDTFSFAMKATAQYHPDDGHWVDLFKDPVTDSGKRSLKGRVVTYQSSDGRIFADRESLGNFNHDLTNLMRVVSFNGIILTRDSFQDVKLRANHYL